MQPALTVGGHAALKDFALDPAILHLNNGSYGATPRAVLAEQELWRVRMEKNPVRFLTDDLPGRLRAGAAEVALRFGGDADGWVFVENATSAVNGVLNSLRLRAGDVLVTTSHAYGAVLKAMRRRAGETGAEVRIAFIPPIVESEDQIVEAIENSLCERTRLLIADHITSPTAIVFPVARIVASARGRPAQSVCSTPLGARPSEDGSGRRGRRLRTIRRSTICSSIRRPSRPSSRSSEALTRASAAKSWARCSTTLPTLLSTCRLSASGAGSRRRVGSGPPGDVLAEALGTDLDPELYWQQVKTNLLAGRIRLVFVADAIPAELRRIVEFLNARMSPPRSSPSRSSAIRWPGWDQDARATRNRTDGRCGASRGRGWTRPQRH